MLAISSSIETPETLERRSSTESVRTCELASWRFAWLTSAPTCTVPACAVGVVVQLGVLGSCLTHSYEIQAALLQIPLQSLEVELSALIDPRAGSPGHEGTPVYPHDISFTVHIVADVSDQKIQELRANVERSCPILNLLKNPQSLAGRIEHVRAPVGQQAAA